MGFIEKLYSNDLCAPILFTIVGILTVLFIVVLILALKDAKKSQKSVVEIADTPVANPSRPSIRLTALVTPTIQK